MNWEKSEADAASSGLMIPQALVARKRKRPTGEGEPFQIGDEGERSQNQTEQIQNADWEIGSLAQQGRSAVGLSPAGVAAHSAYWMP